MEANIFLKDVRQGMKNLTVTVIVLDVGNPTTVKDNREVRTLKVADSSACINLSVWDEPGHYLIPGDIIRLTKASATIFRNCLTLYSSKAGEIDKIGDFCMVFNEQFNMSDPTLTFEPPAGSMNNGGMNNGGKVVRPAGPLILPPTGPPQPMKPPQRFLGPEAAPLRPVGKMNNQKGGRGGGKSGMVRPERR